MFYMCLNLMINDKCYRVGKTNTFLAARNVCGVQSTLHVARRAIVVVALPTWHADNTYNTIDVGLNATTIF